MIEILAFALVIETALLGAVLFFSARERGQLLDRLMARNWAEYKVVTSGPVEREAVTQGSDEAKDREWAEKHGLQPV